MDKECAYPNIKQIGCTVLWKLQRNKANEPHNKDEKELLKLG